MLNSDLPVNTAGKACGKIYVKLGERAREGNFLSLPKSAEKSCNSCQAREISLATGPFCRET